MKHIIIVASFFISLTVNAQDANNSVKEGETAYTKMIRQRAGKIVEKLSIADSNKFWKVREMIAAQYSNLNDIYNNRDAVRKSVKDKDNAGINNKPDVAMLKSIDDATERSTDSLHKMFIAQLATLVSEQQIIQIKDGMTYGVLPLTYNAYLDELPTLSDVQKAQIMVWLVEAREHSMDAESSEKKHAWFGKYKGRINNYLSKEGYDMKKAGEEWQKRIKAKQQN
jgi:hypothetical protein